MRFIFLLQHIVKRDKLKQVEFSETDYHNCWRVLNEYKDFKDWNVVNLDIKTDKNIL